MGKVTMRCYVCDTLAQFFCKNIFTLTTKHSETPVYQFFEKFLGCKIDSEEVEKIVCQDCLIKIDEYDLAFTTAQKIEKELTLLVNRTRNKCERDSCGRFKKKQKAKPEFLDDYTEPMNKVEVAMCEQPVLLKCNVCDETFESLTQMTSHKHKKFSKKSTKKKESKKDLTDDEDDDDTFESLLTPMESHKSTKTETNKDFSDGEDLLIEGTPFTIAMNFEEVDEFSDDGDESRRKAKPSYVPHRCAHDGCDKEFMNKTEFRIHLHSHRDKPEKLVCYICGKTYQSKSALDVHVKMHQGRSPHECAICLKQFTQKGALTRHMRIHTREKPHVCEKCGKAFLHHSSFYLHNKTHKV